MKAPLPANEAQRLEKLRRYDVLDTPPEEAFDDLTLLAAHICQTPMALVSLVDESRQWFKSKVGVDAAETSRDVAFCAHTILNVDEVLEVRDAEADPRFAGTPLVTSDPHIRFYAGAPLVAPDGHALGALCVMDRAPRSLVPDQVDALRALSRHVVSQLELRRQARELATEAAERQRAEARLRQQFDELSASKQEADRLLELAAKSRRTLLSVVEDEKRAGQDLRESEERFRQLAENINEVFWVTDPAKNQMLYISPAYESIWGRTCASLYESPRTWLDAIHPDDRAQVVSAAQTQQARGDYHETYRIERPDGTVRWIRDRAFPVRDAVGQLLRIVGTAEDITERKALESQLAQSQKMEAVGRLAGGIAHDFNNLLTAINGYSELALAKLDERDPLHKSIAEVRKAGTRAAALTGQLLAFSRKQILQPRVLDLNAVVVDIERLLKRLIGEDIELVSRLGESLGCARVDPGQIEQVIVNLAVNARDAMPRGGTLTLETANVEVDENTARQQPGLVPGRYVMLVVGDTGTGMSDHVKLHLFEPFFTTKERGKGTGLGLSTVHGIVQQSGGYVAVQSEVDRGTKFKVYLPRVDAAPDPVGTSDAREGSWQGNETILLVEDESAVRALAHEVLTRAGYKVLEAGRGEEALSVAQHHTRSINLLLTDMVMPGMASPLLARRLVSLEPELRVLYMSGYTDAAVLRDAGLAPDAPFLAKPFSTQKLLSTVRQVLDAVK